MSDIKHRAVVTQTHFGDIASGVQTFHHLTFIYPTVNHRHLITLKFNHRYTLSRSQVSQEKSLNIKTSKIIT